MENTQDRRIFGQRVDRETDRASGILEMNYSKEVLTCLYAKRGIPEDVIINFAYFNEEWTKDPETIKSGNHPYIGYVDRSKPWKITDAWWMP